MRVRSALSAVAAGGALAATAFTGTAEAHGGFAGSWTATDGGDGSSMTLTVQGGGGGRYSVRLFDDAASTCGGVPANVVGAGMAEGDTLWARVTLTCLPPGNIFRHRLVISFTYDVTTDTLWDGDLNEWSRAG